MAKRPRYSRWRRLPSVFRSGEHHLPDPGQEPRRLTLYLPDTLLGTAEAQATRAGFGTVQEYCAELLVRAIEAERVRDHVADVEARRGPLEGLNEIANDLEYLAEWSAQAGARDLAPTPEPGPASPPGDEPEAMTPISTGPPMLVRIEAAPDSISPAAEVILRHAAQGEDDARAFLPSLRRGEAAPMAEVAELAQALNALETECRGRGTLDRRLAFALHRLAYESQVLHTDAWPGAFDPWTVDTVRAVQEAVERILSGQDIRYFPDDFGPRPGDPQ